MVRKLFSVVCSDSENNIFEWLEQGYRGLGHICCTFAIDLGRDGKLRHPLNYRYQSAAVALANYSVDLPVSDT